MHAVARLALEPVLRNVQVSWVKMGREGALEALQAGVLHHAHNGDDLADQLSAVLGDPAAYAALVAKTEHFNAAHAGSVDKHMAAFLPWLQERSAQ